MSNAAIVIEHDPEPQPRKQVAVQATTPSDLLAMAVQQGADLDKLQKLMDLQDRWEANEARKAFTVAMTGFKAEPVQILKRKNVSFTTRDGDTTSYNHAELSDITDAIGPALAKHQLSFRWNIHQEGGSIKVDCILMHARGHSEQVTMFAAPDASGKKNAIQQVASTTTYLQRYTLLAITGMSTKGMDDDGRGSELPEIDPAELDWLDKIKQAPTHADCRAVKAELVLAYGNVQAIPKTLIGAYNARIAGLKDQA